jgi:hypothetical protein
MADKAHSVTVTITSRSNGSVNQEVAFTEFAGTSDELVLKHFTIADKVVAAVNAACAVRPWAFARAAIRHGSKARSS